MEPNEKLNKDPTLIKQIFHGVIVINAVVYSVSFIFCIILVFLDYFLEFERIATELNWVGMLYSTMAFIPCIYITVLYFGYKDDKPFNLEDHLIEK